MKEPDLVTRHKSRYTSCIVAAFKRLRGLWILAVGGTIRTLSSHLLGSDLGLQAWRPDLARHCQSQNAVTYAVLSKTILSGTNQWSEFRFHSIKMNKPRLTWMDRMHMIPFINHVDSIWKEVLFQLKDAWYKLFAKDQANKFHPQEKSEVLIQELI